MKNKLISLTEYVLIKEKYIESCSDERKMIAIPYCMGEVIKYANFLSQPLELGMFIPCDKEGNVLTYKVEHDFEIEVNSKCEGWQYYGEGAGGFYYDNIAMLKSQTEYLDAKERVIFELKGHKVSPPVIYLQNTDNEIPIECIRNDMGTSNFWIWHHAKRKAESVEDLLLVGITLTESKAKGLGL